MYENFYHLTEKPFHLNPDPRFFFGSTGHKRVLAYLSYGIRQGEGFIVVTGEIGAGKTTLIYTLLEELAQQQDLVIAHLATTQPDAGDLLSLVAAAFGLEHEGSTKATLLTRLEAFLLTQARANKRALLIVDEAQDLSREGLEVLRMLTNFQDDHKPLLQGFLIGQAEFRDTLRSRQLEQLRQRVIASCHLGPLDREEIQKYIEHRLTIAGWQGDPAFTPEAYTLIQDYTAGIPRRINTFCDRILLVGYLEEAHEITRDVVNTVILELHSELAGNDPATDAQTGLRIASGSLTIDGQPAGTVEHRLAILETRLGKIEEAIVKVCDLIGETVAGRLK